MRMCIESGPFASRSADFDVASPMLHALVFNEIAEGQAQAPKRLGPVGGLFDALPSHIEICRFISPSVVSGFVNAVEILVLCE